MNNDKGTRKISLPVIISILVVLLIIIFILIFKPFSNNNSGTSSGTTVSKNEELKINEENITIKVNSVEQVNIKSVMFGSSSTDYIKVNVSITNNSNKDISITPYSFNLLTNQDEEISDNSAFIDDDKKISGQLSAKSSMTGNLYFEAKLEKGMGLQYSAITDANMSSDGKISTKTKNYIINLD